MRESPRVSRPVCILGMHRSGTSLTAAIVAALGLDFGPPEGLMSANPADNPAGYYEQDEVTQLNEELLEAYRGGWWRPPRMLPGLGRARRLGPQRDRAAALVRTLYGDARWCFKDPRFSLTLPFWIPIVGEMDHLICVRDPREVAASLLSRARVTLSDTAAAGLDAADWVRVWQRYNDAALANTRGMRRLIVCHADLLQDGGTQAVRIAEFLGLDGEPEELLRLVRPELWRNRADRLALLPVSGKAQRIYDRLALAARADVR
jgi:Sulfotransferase family